MPVKVMSSDEPRSMDNGTMVCEGLVGDETGTVIMSFWNDEIETAQTDVVLDLKDARAHLVRGHMRLSLGKKGSMKESDIVLDNIKQSVNLSDLEYEMPRMGGRGGPGRGGPRGGGRKPLGRWGDLMQLKRETGNKKFFNRDEMTEDQIIAAIKEMGGE